MSLDVERVRERLAEGDAEGALRAGHGADPRVLLVLAMGVARRYAGDKRVLGAVAEFVEQLCRDAGDEDTQRLCDAVSLDVLSRIAGGGVLDEIQGLVERGDWLGLVDLYSGLGGDELAATNKLLEKSGYDPEEFWRKVIGNAVVQAIESGRYGYAEKLIHRYSDLLGPDEARRLKTTLYTYMATKCGLNKQCVERLLEKTPDDGKTQVAKAWLAAAINTVIQHSGDIDGYIEKHRDTLEYMAKLAEKHGLKDIARDIKAVLEAPETAAEAMKGIKEALDKIPEELANEINEALKTGDPEKIRGLIEEHGETLAEITIDKENKLTLKDYLEAVAWLYENKDNIASTADKATKLAEKLNNYIEEKQENPRARIGEYIDAGELHTAVQELEKLRNTHEYQVLEKLGATPDVTNAFNQLLAQLYIAEALACTENGDTEEAEEALDKAAQLWPDAKNLYTFITLGATPLSDDDLECIIHGLGITGETRIKPEIMETILRGATRAPRRRPRGGHFTPRPGGGFGGGVPNVPT